MTRSNKRVGSAAGVVLASALLVLGCGGGNQVPQLPPPPPPTPGAPPPTPTTLHVLRRVLYGGTDRMTCCGSVDTNAYPSEGQMFYVPDQPGTSRSALNRYVNTGVTDHADAIDPPANFTLDEILGYPWTEASLPGIAPLPEGFDANTGDHALLLPSESLPGYSASSLGVYGYPRFANRSEVLLSLSAGGVTVESNEVAGGVTWRWYWNGMQFENHFGYGGEIQAAFYFGTSSALNPNEAGDGYSSFRGQQSASELTALENPAGLAPTKCRTDWTSSPQLMALEMCSFLSEGALCSLEPVVRHRTLETEF